MDLQLLLSAKSGEFVLNSFLTAIFCCVFQRSWGTE